MRVRSIPALCGLAALLAACAGNGVHAGTTSKSGPAAAPTNGAARAATATVPPSPQGPSPQGPSPRGSRTEKWIDLQVGECVADLPPADGSRVAVTVVDCGTAHLAEVYLRAPVAVDNAVADVANRACAAGVAPYTGQSLDGSPFSVAYLIDSFQDRTGADPTPSTVICLLQSANGQPLTASVHH
jgi:hypothetical protein